jgi:basic membrane lipoprotein Med (substrate-binding protein (PBP1-ABC) superfamily)
MSASARRGNGAVGPRWLRPVMGTRRRRIVTYAVTLACAAVAGVLAVQHETTVSAAPRARIYLAFDACLLTRERGLAGPQAAQAWAGLQRASLATHAKVEYLPVMGAQTIGGALPVLSSLLQRNCNVIVAAGTPQIAAVDQDAARYPAVRFATVGGPAGGSNVTVLSTATAQIAPAVDNLVTAAVQASGSS